MDQTTLLGNLYGLISCIKARHQNTTKFLKHITQERTLSRCSKEKIYRVNARHYPNIPSCIPSFSRDAERLGEGSVLAQEFFVSLDERPQPFLGHGRKPRHGSSTANQHRQAPRPFPVPARL